jgi:glycosyltransferase involved in cell wall biosynthesis
VCCEGEDRGVTPIKLTAVMTHPVQYLSPWFRHIATHAPSIDLTVLYATRPTPEQQGVRYGLPFDWDVALTDGYRCRIVRPAQPRDCMDSEQFWGLDVPQIGAALADTTPDVVLLPGWQSVTMIRALWAARRLGVPVLYRGDSHAGSAPRGWRRPLWGVKTRLLLRAFDGYLCVGHRVRDHLIACGVHGSRIFNSPHAVDHTRFAAAADASRAPNVRPAIRRELGVSAETFAVLFVGALEARKRPIDLIRAVAALGRGVTILYAGSGALEGACRAEAGRLNVSVRFLGFVNQSALGRVYGAADCLALPSAGETWGLVVNEALASGCPAVVSDTVGCAPDLIDDSTGAVFRVGDSADLRRALALVRDRCAAGHDYRLACQARAATYSFDRATVGTVAACESVVARRHRRAPRIVACCGHMVSMTGLERMTFEVLRSARERGAAVHCIVNTWSHDDIVSAAEQIGATWSTGYYWYPLRRRRARPFVGAIQIAWDVLQTSRGLVHDARRCRATHVLLAEHGTAVRNLPGLLWLRLGGLHVVMKLGNAPDETRFYRRLWRWVVNPAVSTFVCNSQFTQSELLAHGIPRTKATVIHNTAPRRTSAPACDVPASRIPGRIVYVGQIIPDKGVDLLLDAVAALVARGRDASLDIIGRMDGWEAPEYAGYRDSLFNRARQPDLDGRVRFLGWQDHVQPFLEAGVVHCAPSLPSAREGFGLVNLEAKLAGMPSVVFRSGAFPEIIDHQRNGWVCDVATVAALADGLDYFLTDPARTAQAGAAARRSYEPYNGEAYRREWAAIFGIDGADLKAASSSPPAAAPALLRQR